MKMLRLPAIATAFTLMVAAPAIAQAPISQGRTATTQLQANNAELRLEITDLQAENASLRGEVETLGFLLSETRDQLNQMQEDDQEISRQLDALNSRISQLSSKVEEFEGRRSVSKASRATGSRPSTSIEDAEASPPPAQRVRRNVATNSSGPRNISGSRTRTVTTSTPSEDSTASTESLAKETTTIKRVVTTPSNNPAQSGSLGTISASNLPGEAGPLFAEAKSRLTKFDHAGAEEAFRSFLETFGDDPQAGEAQYWLGETLYQQGAYAEAGAAYTKMIQSYPDDLRAPDALVKLARAMRLVGESERACAALAELPKRYPNPSAVTKNLAAVEATRSSCG